MTVAGKVSVLVTTFNHAPFVEDALQSILNQTYPHLEIVVADDGSSDATPAIIKQMAAANPRILPVLSEVNRGISINWNRAYGRCSGEYVALLSGDDVMLPDKLARQVAFLQSHPECGVCTHDMELFESRTGRTLHRLSDRFARKDGGPEVMFTANWFFGREIKSIPSSHMFRASIIGRHRFDERLWMWNEWLHEIDCVVTSGLRWGSLPDVLGRYRVHDRQTSTSEEAHRLDFEESMMVLAIAEVRYPELAPLIRNKRQYALFSHLVFDWFPEKQHAARERQFWSEAGAIKWLYMKTARFVVRRRWLLEGSRPGRRLVRWLLRKA